MPTAKLIQPQQTDASDAPLADADVNALLSQADALMNDMQANLDEQGADTATTTNDKAIHEMAEEITTSADTADANAIMAMLNQDSPNEHSAEAMPAAPSTDATNAVDAADAVSQAATPESGPISTDSPHGLSEDWLKQTNTSDEQIPHIPDDNSSAPPAADETVTAGVTVPKAGKSTKWFGPAVRWTLLHLVRLPLDILILLDRPFAKMNPRTKSFIGYAAISTTVVAVATWAYGDLRQTS